LGLFEFLGGMAFAIIVIVVLLILGVYIFGPNVIPSTPCIANFNCHVQKVCCTYRCDSTDMGWWQCPDKLCSFLNETQPAKTCGCKSFKCQFK